VLNLHNYWKCSYDNVGTLLQSITHITWFSRKNSQYPKTGGLSSTRWFVEYNISDTRQNSLCRVSLSANNNAWHRHLLPSVKYSTHNDTPQMSLCRVSSSRRNEVYDKGPLAAINSWRRQRNWQKSPLEPSLPSARYQTLDKWGLFA
jgi:hypothetical protein